MSGKSSVSEEGYLLLEVIVAFVIATLALTMLYQSVGEAYRGMLQARASEETLALARSQMEKAMAEGSLRVGTVSGRYDNGAAWDLTVTPVSNFSPNRSGLRPCWVTVRASDAQGRTLANLKTVVLVGEGP